MADWGASLRSPTPENLPAPSGRAQNATDTGTDGAAAETLVALSTERNFLLDELDLSRRQDAKAFVPDPFALTKIRAAFKADQADKTGRGLTGFFAADKDDDVTNYQPSARLGLRAAEDGGVEQEPSGVAKGRKTGRHVPMAGKDNVSAQRIRGLVPASKVDNFGNQAQPDASAGDEEDEMGRKRHSGWIGLDGKPLPAKRAKKDGEAGNVRHIPGRGVVASVIGNTTAPSTYKPPLSAVEKAEKRKAARLAKDAEKAKAKAENEAKKAKASLMAALDKTPKGNKAKGKKQAAGKGSKKKKAEMEEEEEEEDKAVTSRGSKRSKEDDGPPKFRRIPKDAAPTDDFPIVQGLERQKSLPVKKRDKTVGSLPLSPFPLSMPSTENSGGRLDLDKLFDGLSGAPAKASTAKRGLAGGNTKEEHDELDSDNGSAAGHSEEKVGKSLVLQRFLRGDTPPLLVVEQELDIPLGDSANPIPVDKDIVTPQTAQPAGQPSTISQLSMSASRPSGHATTSSSQVPYSSPLAGKTTGAGEQLIKQPKPFKHSDDRALTALVGFNGSLESACAISKAREQSRATRDSTPETAKGPIPDVYNHKGFYSGDMRRKTENLFSTLPSKKSKSRSLAAPIESQRHPLLSSAWTPSTPSTSASESVRSSGKFNLPLAPFRKPASSAYVQPSRAPAAVTSASRPKEADQDTSSYTKLTMFKAPAPKPTTDSDARPRFTVETIRGSQYAGSDPTRLSAPVRFRGAETPRFAQNSGAVEKNQAPQAEVTSTKSHGLPTYAQSAQNVIRQSQVQRDEEWETGWTRNKAVTARQGLRPALTTVVDRQSPDRRLAQNGHHYAPHSPSGPQAAKGHADEWGATASRYQPMPHWRDLRSDDLASPPSTDWSHRAYEQPHRRAQTHRTRMTVPSHAYTDNHNADRPTVPTSYY